MILCSLEDVYQYLEEHVDSIFRYFDYGDGSKLFVLNGTNVYDYTTQKIINHHFKSYTAQTNSQQGLHGDKSIIPDITNNMIPLEGATRFDQHWSSSGHTPKKGT